MCVANLRLLLRGLVIAYAPLKNRDADREATPIVISVSVKWGVKTKAVMSWLSREGFLAGKHKGRILGK